MIEKEIPDFPGYTADDFGMIRSYRVRGNGFGKIKTKGLVLKQTVGGGGYMSVTVYKNKQPYIRTVGDLVLTAFVGPRPKGMQVCHGPLGKFNNTPSNLYWGTPSRNNLDKYRDGTMYHPIGEKNNNAVLNRQQILDIVELLKTKNELDIAKKFGVHKSTVSNIAKGFSWSHVTHIGRKT